MIIACPKWVIAGGVYLLGPAVGRWGLLKIVIAFGCSLCRHGIQVVVKGESTTGSIVLPRFYIRSLEFDVTLPESSRARVLSGGYAAVGLLALCPVPHLSIHL
jgi:hypothetical protein